MTKQSPSDTYFSDPDRLLPDWHDNEPASSVRLHAESGSEPDIWLALWWLYPPVIIHSSVYGTVRYVMVQRTVYSTVRYVIVQRNTVYSIVKYNVCDSKGKHWYIKHCYLEYNQIQQDLPISVFHMKKSVQKTITDIFISESVKINFEKKLTLPFSVNLNTFFSATFSFLSGGVMSILERPFLRGDRCDILWLLCVGTTDSSSLSLSSEADLKINVIMRWLRELVI